MATELHDGAFRTPLVVGDRRHARAAGWVLVVVAAGALLGAAAAGAAGARPSPAGVGLVVLAHLVAFGADVAAAVLLTALVAPVDRVMAITAGALRVLYAAVVTSVLFTTLLPLTMPSGTPGAPADAAPAMAAFQHGFTVSLSVFGVHLALLGFLLARSGLVPRALGWAVAAGGAAYVANAVTALTLPSVHAATSGPLGVLGFAELVLALWLIADRRLRPAFTVPA